MADTTETKAENKDKAPEIFKMIAREGIEMPFVLETKTRGDETYPIDKDTKQPDKTVLLKDAKYPAPYVTEENVLDWIKWMSLTVSAKKIGAFLNQYAQRIMEAVKEQLIQNNRDPEAFDEEAIKIWEQLIPELAFRGEKLSVLQENLLDVIDRMSSLPDNMPDDQYILESRKLRAEADKLKVLIRNKKRSPREAKEGAPEGSEAAKVA